jgi:hypothetical protein
LPASTKISFCKEISLQMEALNTRMYNNHLYINIQLGTSHKVKGGWVTIFEHGWRGGSRGGWTGGSRDTQSFYTCFQSVFIRDLTSVVERVPAIKIIKYGCFRHTTMPSSRICRAERRVHTLLWGLLRSIFYCGKFTMFKIKCSVFAYQFYRIPISAKNVRYPEEWFDCRETCWTKLALYCPCEIQCCSKGWYATLFKCFKILLFDYACTYRTTSPL